MHFIVLIPAMVRFIERIVQVHPNGPCLLREHLVFLGFLVGGADGFDRKRFRSRICFEQVDVLVPPGFEFVDHFAEASEVFRRNSFTVVQCSFSFRRWQTV
jgi:hypothetical protein